MKCWILLLAGIVFVTARPTDDEQAAAAGAATSAETSAADVIEGTTRSAETTATPKNWLAALLGEEQYSQPEIISQEAASRPKISGYGRRRRSGDVLDDDAAALAITDVAVDAVKIRNHGQYGELTRRQPIGAKQGGVVTGGSRYQRRSPSEEDDSLPSDVVLVQVDSGAVKIRNRGKYGNIAQTASHPAAVSSRLVFDDTYAQKQQRQRREADAVVVANFIPFSEYDAQRVQILKVEQNDFMALPKRLADKTPQVLQQG